MASSMTPVFPAPVGALTTTFTSDWNTGAKQADCTELKYLCASKRYRSDAQAPQSILNAIAFWLAGWLASQRILHFLGHAKQTWFMMTVHV